MNPFDLESETFRILYQNYYALAGKAEETANKIAEAASLLEGNGESDGLLDQVVGAREGLAEALEEIRKLNRGYLEQQIVALNAAVDQFPARLMGEFSSKEFLGRLQKQIHGMMDERIVAARSTVVKLIIDDMTSVCSEVSKNAFGEPAEAAAEKARLSELLRLEMLETKRLNDLLSGGSPQLHDAKKRIWGIAAITTFPAGIFIGLLSGSAAVELLKPFLN